MGSTSSCHTIQMWRLPKHYVYLQCPLEQHITTILNTKTSMMMTRFCGISKPERSEPHFLRNYHWLATTETPKTFVVLKQKMLRSDWTASGRLPARARRSKPMENVTEERARGDTLKTEAIQYPHKKLKESNIL